MSLLKRATAKSLMYGDVILRNGERLQVEHIEQEIHGAMIEFIREFGGRFSVFMPYDEQVTIEL